MLDLRPLRDDDADAVVGVFREAFGDERPLDAHEIRSWLRNDELKPEWLKVLEVDGRVAGYGDIWIQDDELALDVAAPGHWEPFIDWAEREARTQRLARVRLFFPAGHELERVAAERGYRLWRSSYTMEVDLGDGPPPPPEFPAGITVRPYRDDDEETLRAALNEAFDRDPFFHDVSPSAFREFYVRSRGFDPALWILAWDGDDLAGFVLAYSERVGEPGVGWVGSLGVRAPWRRRGLGEALLRSAFAALHERGFRRVGLGVDTENETGALRLYERVGMHAVRRGDNWVREP